MGIACIAFFAGLVFTSLPKQTAAAEYQPTDSRWLDSAEIEPMGKNDYSVALIGDTQAISRLYPEALEATSQWLAENKSELNLKFVIGAGDIVDGVGHTFTPRHERNGACPRKSRL